VHVESVGRVRVVTIARPERRNAVDRDTAEALADAFRAFDGDEGAAVAVLTGAGEHFCAGADLRAAADGRPNRIEPDGDGPMGPTRMRLAKPVIAAVEGYCVAGGLEVALWCDLRVASESAVFGVFSRRFGVPLIDGGTVRLPRAIGMSRALDLILTGRHVDAREAHAIGLANRLVSRGEARAAAVELAESVAAHPQVCLRADLASSRVAFDGATDDRLAAEFTRGRTAFEAEGRAGARAFAAGEGRHGAARPEAGSSPSGE
jgi:enoyl-CoA hydratase